MDTLPSLLAADVLGTPAWIWLAEEKVLAVSLERRPAK